jgi:5'-methylthioadenosine phosphorylase
MYRGWGADVIGMTAMPEARLAREAELPYALLGMVTDWDSWREEEAEVDVAQILKVMHENVSLARGTVNALAAALPELREASPIDRALDNAVMTDRTAWDVELVARLGAVAGRVLG